jgi:ElaB/YqjD/DUF883 family membrane-anchored ribosome-binding protein
MKSRVSLRQELDELRAEFESLRKSSTQSASRPPDPAAPAGSTGLEHQIAELNRLVQMMLDEAEETVTEHPVATVAGALALGIVIGRITAR